MLGQEALRLPSDSLLWAEHPAPSEAEYSFSFMRYGPRCWGAWGDVLLRSEIKHSWGGVHTFEFASYTILHRVGL